MYLVNVQTAIGMNSSDNIVYSYDRELIILDDGKVTSADLGHGDRYVTRKEAEEAIRKFHSVYANKHTQCHILKI